MNYMVRLVGCIMHVAVPACVSTPLEDVHQHPHCFEATRSSLYSTAARDRWESDQPSDNVTLQVICILRQHIGAACCGRSLVGLVGNIA
jgi:hypothetical protein